jgi:hypothetical protein
MELRDVIDFHLEGSLTTGSAGVCRVAVKFKFKGIRNSKMRGEHPQNSSTSDG